MGTPNHEPDDGPDAICIPFFAAMSLLAASVSGQAARMSNGPRLAVPRPAKGAGIGHRASQTKSTMQLGISYYPEYYPSTEWDRHFDLLVRGGFKRVRFGESSWAEFQPSRDEFRWEVLDAAIEKAASFGVEVVLGTPTYVPPLWLVKEHPEVLPVGADGRRTVFGARQHRCFNTRAYVDAALVIAEQMVRRYGRHPNVVAWQIDNELGGEQKRCHCDNCRRAFQLYLRDKYGSLADLNRRWNTVFWGQRYDDWADLPVPIRPNADLQMRHHPTLELDFQRFCSDSIVRFCEAQYDVMRPHTAREITHNTDTFYWGDNVDVHRLFRRLDVAGMDVYSDRPFEIAFYSDLTRGVSKTGRFWMMEFSTRSPRLPAEMDVMAAHGCDWLYLFKMLPFPWGQEMDRKALLSLTGNPEPNYHAVRTWAESRKNSASIPVRPARAALYYHFDSSWAHFIDQWRPDIAVPDRQGYPKYVVETVYRALFEAGVACDIIFSPEDIARYDTVFLARQIIHEPELERAAIDLVERGGRLVVTSDLFRRDSDNVWLEYVPDIYRQVFHWTGADIPDDTQPAHFQPLHGRHGRGEAWLLHKDAPLDRLRQLVGDLFELRPAPAAEPSVTSPAAPVVYDQRGRPPKTLVGV